MNTRFSIPKACHRSSAACAISLTVFAALPGHAQQNLTVTNSLKVEATSSASRLELLGNGILLGRGNSAQNNLSQTELMATSPLLMCNPGNSAFRAGFFGPDVQYSGTSSAAFGYYSYAPGFGAFAAGRGNASGDYAVAMGSSVQALGNGSVALGLNTVAGAPGAFAMGSNTVATGIYSVAVGLQTQAVGYFSFTGNQQTVATGDAATAFGISTRADTLGSVAIGRFNVGAATTGGATVWRSTDPVFEIGNGLSSSQRSNVFTVYKNGTADLGGQPVITASTFPTYLGNASIALSSADNRSISINPSSSGVGKSLTIQAGNSANGTDLGGGGLILSGGNSTGNAGSAIEFRTATSGSTTGTAATIRPAAVRMTINPAGGIWAGEGLSASMAPQFVLGKFNNAAPDNTTTPPTDRTKGVFIIGAGTSAIPKNAMRVTEDGTILIQPAGDIDVGDFNEGERP